MNDAGLAASISFLTLVMSCATPAAMTNRAPDPPDAVDSARVRSADEVSGWTLSREVAADLDADGTRERVLLSSDVTIGSNGRALWEDGHRWGVVVDDDGRRTLLYGAFVPNGHVETAILDAAPGSPPLVLIVERTPQQLRTFTLAYESPDRTRVVSSATYPVAAWTPSLLTAQP